MDCQTLGKQPLIVEVVYSHHLSAQQLPGEDIFEEKLAFCQYW